MAKYRFNVKRVDVIPDPYPFGITYWRLGMKSSIDGDIYTLVMETENPEQIRRYWPNAYMIEAFTNDYSQRQLYAKRSPTGSETGILRVHFLYPLESAYVGLTPYPDHNRQRACDDPNMALWTACVDSISQLKEHWPQAWDIDVLADTLTL